MQAQETNYTNVIAYIVAMAAVVVLSNILVQYPLQATLIGVNLADLLTWGAFTYPVAFFVTDLTNRKFGKEMARIVVAVGFLIAVVWSIGLATPRIAIASGVAFLLAQLLDVSIFDRLRQSDWWKAPLVSSFIGSVIDTILFFGIAFAPAFNILDFGGVDGSLAFPVPFLGLGADVPLWTSLATGDFIIKVLVSTAMLVPYALIASKKSSASA